MEGKDNDRKVVCASTCACETYVEGKDNDRKVVCASMCACEVGAKGVLL
jgi:hypothetical protein